MRRFVSCAAVLAALLSGCGSDPEPTGCALCSADATCVESAGAAQCICNPSFVGDGRTCTATGLQPGAPWPAEGGNAARSGQSVHVGPQVSPAAPRWRFATDGAGTVNADVVGSPVIGADGTIYVTTFDEVYAVAPGDGSMKWSYAGGSGWSTPAIGADGTIYVHGFDNTSDKLVALDPSSVDPVLRTPAVRWSVATAVHDFSAPIVGSDGTVYVQTRTGLRAVKGDGTGTRWSASLTLDSQLGPALGGGKVYVTGENGEVYAVDPVDGSVEWSSPASGTFTTGLALGPDGTVYVTIDDEVLARSRVDGGLRWTWGAGASWPAIGADGTVHVVGANAILYALDPAAVAQGATTPKWSFDLGSATFVSPALGADGTVYVGDDAGHLRAIAGGAVEWSFQGEHSFALSTPAIGADGTLYVGDAGGYLNAFAP